MEITNLKDKNNWPIVIGGRVRVCTVLTSGKKTYKHGEVVKIDNDLVEIRLFKNLNMITVKPETVEVMKGRTRQQFEFEIIRSKFAAVSKHRRV